MRWWALLFLLAFSAVGFGRVLHRLRDDPNFVGRARELELVRDELSRYKRFAIVGTAGIGKTNLALEYVRRSQNEYDAVFWLDPKGNIAASLKELAAHLDVPTGKRSLDMIVDSIKHQLDITRQKFLLVFDSMPDDPLQLSFLPAPGGRSLCHVLITSRSCKLSREERAVELGPLERSDSIALLKSCSGGLCTDRVEAEKIADYLEDFPLALRQAGAYLAHSKESVACYIERVHEAAMENTSSESYAKSLAAAGFLSMQVVQESHPVARQVLAISSLINGNDIPISLIDKMVHPKGVLDEALAALSDYALISLEEETFTVHRFFQRMVLSHLSENEQARYLRDALHFFNYHFNYAREQVHKDEHLEEVYPHLKALLGRPLTDQLEPWLSARMRGKIGAYELWEHDAYHAALKHLEKALKIYENQPNTEEKTQYFGHSNRAQAQCAELHFAIGTACQHLGRHLEAKRHFEISLALFKQVEKALRNAHRPSRFGQAIASSWHGLARVAYDMGDFPLSKKLFKKALAVNKAFYNTEERFFIARDIHWLGCLCVWEGDFNQAIDLFKRSLEISRHVFSTDLPPYSGATLCELGKIYMDLGRFDLAYDYLQEAVRSEEKYHGAVGSPHCARAHHLLARHHLYLGNFDQADKHLHEALLMRMILYGSEKHPKVVDTLRLRGSLCLERGDWRLARTYLEKVYRIDREVPINECKDLAETLISLGDCANLRSDLEGAKTYYEEALKVQCSESHTSTPKIGVGIELMLGQLHFGLGNYSEALYYLKRAKKNASSLFSTADHLHIAHADRTLGKIAVQQSEYQKAEQYYSRALEMYRKLYKTDEHPYISELFIEIAELNYKLGDYEEAFDLCEQARKINAVVFKGDIENLYLADILNWQGRIFYREGKFQQALELLNRAKEIVELHFPKMPTVYRASANHYLADVLWSLGRYEEAYQAGSKATSEFHRIYKKPVHSNIIDSNIALAKVCISLEKYGEAEKLLSETLQRVNSLNSGSVDHRKAHTYFWLGSLEQALGNYKLAESYFRKEYYILSAIHKSNPNHPYIGMAYLKLADCLIHQENRRAAHYYYKKALAVQKENGFVLKHQAFSEKVHRIKESLSEEDLPSKAKVH